MVIRTFFAQHNLWRHIAALACNAKVFAVGRNVVIVANQHFSGFRIDKKVAVIQILIAVAPIMQRTKAADNAQCRMNYRINARKMNLCQQKT